MKARLGGQELEDDSNGISGFTYESPGLVPQYSMTLPSL